MELFNRIVFVLSVFLLELCWTSTGQRLFSIFTQVLPTRNVDEVMFYSHLSWEQQNVTNCFSPACLRVYRLTNKTAQFFGRMTDYQWTCTQGCVTNDVISDLSKLMFTEVNSYHGNKWESGEEVVTYRFKPGASDNVHFSLQRRNGSIPHTVESVQINIGTRNDTNRSNVSPSVAVLPIYQVPLGCRLDIDLSPYDGDGDYTTCTWTHKLQSATLNQKSCTIVLDTSTGGGYVAGQYYMGTVSIEDYSNTAVSISRHSRTSVTRGPFSKLPVRFTVYISAALPDKTQCLQVPTFEPRTKSEVGSYLYPTTYSSTFTSTSNNVTMLTVGHLSTVFSRTTNTSATTEHAEWVLAANETGIYRTCVMLYSNKGVAGETRCDTLLISDADECTSNNTCIDYPGGHCKDYWHYHTCTYDNQGKHGDPGNLGNQGRPSNQSHPCNQGDPCNQGNPYNQSHSGNQGVSCNQSHPCSQCNPDKQGKQDRQDKQDKQETTPELNIALIAGAAGGGVVLLVAMVTGIIVYLKYFSKRKGKVKDINEKQQTMTY